MRGRVVVVVEAGARRGEAVARRLAGEGATVVVVGGDAEGAGRLLASIERDGAGRGAFFSLGEPPPPEDLDALALFVAEWFGEPRRPPDPAA